jgi:hypothetical protein
MLLFASLLVALSFALNCNVGTNDAFSSQTCPNPTEECISAYLSTGGSPDWNISSVEGAGTQVYACGNCTFYKVDLSRSFVHTVTCCNTTDCNIVGTVSTSGTCDSIVTESGCTNRRGKDHLIPYLI